METQAELRILIIVLVCCSTPAESQDGIESSGGGAFTSEVIIPGLFETLGSGTGPDTTDGIIDNGDIISDLAQELNGTYIPLLPNIGSIKPLNDTIETDLSETTTDVRETTFLETTTQVRETTTTRETTVLTDGIEDPVIDTSTHSTESSTETTTKLLSTTTPLATTSRPTTLHTTKRPPPPKTVKPVLTTTSTSDYDPLPCSFNAHELECSEELVCFGEGEVDCTEPDESEPLAKASAVLHSTAAEYEDEYEDPVMSSTEASDLAIRLPAWKKLSGMKRHQFSSTTATPEMNPAEETSSKAAVPDETSPESKTNSHSTLRVSDITALFGHIPTLNTEDPEGETTLKLHSELPETRSEDPLFEQGSLELQTPNAESNNSKDNPNNGTSSELPGRQSTEMTTEKSSSSTFLDNRQSTEMTEPKSRRRRSKRQNWDPVPDSSVLSSSEQLKLSSFSVTSDQKGQKLCRIKGNLLCTPAPTLSLCKGSGRCHAVVEKKEKSTGEKGVENWAIAVIAICATAAAVTISLLIYLVVTSWKKLKVQPQNGVTTLTYVNNATP